MAYPQGIDFRATAIYVTDPANCDSDVGEAYPQVTAQSNTVGWLAADTGNPINRSTSIDPRIAGMNYTVDSTHSYQFDLASSGGKSIRCAMGDNGFGSTAYLEVFDDTNSLGVIADGTTTTGNFRDATNVSRSAANWPGQNVAASLTFTTTTCIFKVGNGSGQIAVAHLWVEDAAAGGATPRFLSTLGVGA